MASAVEDRAGIEEAVFGYSEAANRLDGRGMEKVLMPDATLGGVNAVMGGEDTDVVGARGISDWFAAAFATMTFVHQMPQVISLKVNGDQAEATTMVIEYLRDKATSTLMLILANYEDKLTRTPSGWKFTRRYFRVKSFSKVAEQK